MDNAFFSYLTFIATQFCELADPLRIWCFYEKFGLRTIMMLVSSGIVAFALPNILDQSECKADKDAYIKSLFAKKHKRMRVNSALMLIAALITILTYVAIWNSLLGQEICTPLIVRPDGPERFSYSLALANISSLAIAIVALNQKIFCMKHKQ
ncbi:hypothetical protein [Pseudomonas sp. NMI760_13]|uniref:hypothetical protein n=1 Tax=Pseudomonas sp. NMI760_13 TaxID=2903147 RepID=UPI001E5B452F|nr:hypothetical protein [Pseudomonas sp. NMI760_13]MCE0913014.1 hypothetical protein [Pseudomonas sp. NMI760_13]